MEAEVIAIGSELLLGQIVDTNSAVMAGHLALQDLIRRRLPAPAAAEGR